MKTKSSLEWTTIGHSGKQEGTVTQGTRVGMYYENILPILYLHFKIEI